MPTPGGFGTPDLGDRVLRTDAGLLVDQRSEVIATTNLTSIAEAVSFFDETYVVDWFDGFGDELAPVPPEQTLEVDEEAARFIGDLFSFGAQAIDRFAAVVPGGITEVWIWPEHFDLATEAGDGEAGGKASFGLSPGDQAHEDPYFYVSAWGSIDRSEAFWNDEAFNGASLAYADLVGADDTVAEVVTFFLAGFELLNPS